MITSSQVTKKDIPIILEYSVSAVTKKPIDKKECLSAIAKSVMQNRFPTEITELLRKVNQYKHSQNVTGLAEIAALIANHEQATEAIKTQTESTVALM